MPRLRPRSFLIALLSLVLLAGAGAPAIAQDATPTGGEVTILGPDASFGGATLGEWNARWTQWHLSFPVDTSPGVDPTGQRCGYGQAGPVFFLPGNLGPPGATSTCVVPEGVGISLNLGGANCSTVEPPPFFGRDEDELRACAATATDAIPIATHALSINGQDVPDLASYRTSSPLTPIVFPENNVFGAPAGTALFVNDAYNLLLAPPAPGTYEIVLTVGAQVLDIYQITVEAPQVIEPGEAPEATPLAPSVASPVAAVPCSVEPRAVAEVEAIWASLNGSPIGPQDGPPPFISMADLPQGEPVDPGTIAVIEGVVQQSWACSRIDTLRAFALYTDDFLRGIAPPEGERDMALSGLDVTPAPDELTPAATVSGASEARMLPDGRVGALVTITHPDGFPTVIFYVLEQQPDGRWLIDEEIFVQ